MRLPIRLGDGRKWFAAALLVCLGASVAQLAAAVDANDNNEHNAHLFKTKLMFVEKSLERLDDHFNHTIKRMFYDKQQVADELIASEGHLNGYYALKSVSANVARSEIVQHAIRHKALVVLRDLIRRYFVERSDKLHSMFLDNNADLFKMIGHRVMLRALADELYNTVDIMKRIYLLLFKYCNRHTQPVGARNSNWIVCEDEPELREIALYYFRDVDSERDKINLETSQLELTYKRYEAQALHHRSADQVEHTISAIDNIIDEAMGCGDCIELNEAHVELDGLYSMFRDNSDDLQTLIGRVVDARLLADVGAAEQSAAARLGEIGRDELRSVSMNDIANLRASLRATPPDYRHFESDFESDGSDSDVSSSASDDVEDIDTDFM